MIAILKSDSVKIILAVAGLLLFCGVLIPLIIKAFCLVLLMIFTKPAVSAIAIIAFLLGMFVNEKLK